MYSELDFEKLKTLNIKSEIIFAHSGKKYPFGFDFGNWNKRSIKNTCHHDKLKQQYCKKNKIKLLIIPYTYFNRLEDIILKIKDGKRPRLKQPQVKNEVLLNV